MSTYTYADTKKTVIICSDGRNIPVTPGNRDYDALIASGAEILDYAQTLEEQLAALDTKYQQKFNELKESFTSAMIIDGAPMETNVALLRTKWAALIAAQQAEIDTVFSQE